MLNQFSLANKHILITGASSGIGRACALLCSQAGATLLIVGRNEARLQNTLVELQGQGHSKLVLDLTNSAVTTQLITDCLAQKGPVHGLINAAGITATHPFKYAKPAHFEELFQSNVASALNLTRLCTKKPPVEGMSVVFLTSVMAMVGEKAKSAYSMSKGALLAASRSLALELASKNVRINCISPGVVQTPMTANATYNKSEANRQKMLDKHPLGLGKPEDVANACLFLLSDASRWITGSNLVVDGGYTAL